MQNQTTWTFPKHIFCDAERQLSQSLSCYIISEELFRLNFSMYFDMNV